MWRRPGWTRWTLLTCALGIGALWAAPVSAQVVRARVTDALTDTPVAGVVITVLGDPVLGRTDESGRVILRLRRSGDNVFTVRRLGFAAITSALEVPATDTLNVHFVLQPTPPQLDTVAVTANETPPPGIDAFERRLLKKNGAFFVTRSDIDKQMPTQTSDLLRRAIGVQVSTKALKTVLVSSRGPTTLMGGLQPALCILPVGVDGRIMGPEFDLNTISVESIHGIEVYSGPATIPVEYRGSLANNNCGLVMVWLRHK